MASIRSVWLIAWASLLALSAHGGSGKTLKSTLVLKTALERSTPLSRTEFLTLFGVSGVDADILIRGLHSPDPLKRRICALQLGEGPARGFTRRVVGALLAALRDRDPDVVTQAMASILRIGRQAPEVLLPWATTTALVHGSTFESSRLSVADVAIAGLYESHDVPLDDVARAYQHPLYRAVGAATTREDAGSPVYLRRALAALLVQSPDRNAALIARLLGSEDVPLRDAVLPAAGGVSADDSVVTASVMNLVTKGVNAAERAQAAAVLRDRGDAGLKALFDLSHSTDAGVRGAAWAALASEASCDSPLLESAISDPDAGVREAVLTALLANEARTSRLCLLPLANDADLSVNARMGMLDASAREAGRWAPLSANDVANAVEILRPALIDRDSPLFGPAWSLMGSLLGSQAEGGAALNAMARTLFSRGVVLKDDVKILCALSALPARVLSSDAVLVAELAVAYQPGTASCLGQTLAKLDPTVPGVSAAGRTLAARLAITGNSAGANYSSNDLALLANIMPMDALDRDGRAMTQRTSGKTRLEIYQVLAERGVAVNDALALFAAVMHGDVSGLGDLKLRPQYGDTVPRALHDSLIPAAVDGLLVLGTRGEALLGEVLRSPEGSQAPARLAILSNSKAIPLLQRCSKDVVALAEKPGDGDVRLAAVALLPQLLQGPELSEVSSRLIRDVDMKIAAAVGEWILERDESGVHAAGVIQAREWEFLVNRLSSDVQSENRDEGVRLMSKLHAQFSTAFVAAQLERALRDDDDSVVDTALRLTPDFGGVGVESLRKVLESDKAGRLAVDGLPVTVNAFGGQAMSWLPALLKLNHDQPGNEGVLESIGLLSESSAPAHVVMDAALASSDEHVRGAALAGLSRRQAFFAKDSGLYVAALMEARIAEHVWARVTAITDVLSDSHTVGGGGNGIEEVIVTGSPLNFARFPWPAPPWSFKELLPDGLVAESGASLADVSARIVAAVRSASVDYDYGLFGLPDGFVVLARMERIRADGTPYAGRERWSNEPLPAKTLEEYVIDLFFDPPGYFRTIAFAVTGNEPSATDATASLPAPMAGAKSLPAELGRLSYGERHTYALVYAFERVDGGKMSLNYAGSPSGLTHLKASGIWSGFGQ
jgi:hypothetical protein